LFCRGRQFLLYPLQSGILEDEPNKKSRKQKQKPEEDFSLLIPLKLGEVTQCERFPRDREFSSHTCVDQPRNTSAKS
jgi:hypothetical protein